MRKLFRISITYTPIILVAGQVVCNLLYMATPDLYSQWYPYIASFFGFNLLTALLMTAITFHFRFCAVSRACAIAELIFGIAYLAIPDNDTYNMAIQVTVGVAALLITATSVVVQKENQWTQEQ